MQPLEVKEVFPCGAAVISDGRQIYPVILRLHQSRRLSYARPLQDD